MKAVCFQGVQMVAVNDVTEPQLRGPRDAIVRVSMAGLCGSDLHPFFGREVGLDVGTVMGHELVGEVVELGGSLIAGDQFGIGDRVFVPFSSSCGDCHFCRAGLTSRCEVGQLFGWLAGGQGLDGCQSQYVRVPLADATMLKVPQGVSDEAALLLGDNFSTGYYCADMAEVAEGGTYVVIGCGTVGLLCIMSAISRGAKRIFALDLVPERLSRAESLGAIPLTAGNDAIAQIKAATGGLGADAVMELVGLPDAQRLAFAAVRAGGILSVIGCHCTPAFAFGPSDAYDKNLTYKTGRCPARHYMQQLLPRVERGEFDLAPFITHQFGIEEAVAAYDVFSKQQDGCVKAVLTM